MNETVQLNNVKIDLSMTAQLNPDETLEWLIEDRRCGPQSEVRFCRECNAEVFVANGWPFFPGNVAKCKNGHVAMQLLPFAVKRRQLSLDNTNVQPRGE